MRARTSSRNAGSKWVPCGSTSAAAALFEAHGTHFAATLRDEVLARTEALDLPAYTGFVQPELEPVRDASGAITDVRITYPCDFTAQMLRYADHYATLPA